MQLRVDRDANTLVITPGDASAPDRTIVLPGTIDVGEGGVLLGIEIRASDRLPEPADAFTGWGGAASVDGPSVYITLMAGDDRHARSADIAVDIGLDPNGSVARISIPRRGAGYEITYPSGNR